MLWRLHVSRSKRRYRCSAQVEFLSPSVSGSAKNTSRQSMKFVPLKGSPPIPTHRVCPSPTRVVWYTASYVNVPDRDTMPAQETQLHSERLLSAFNSREAALPCEETDTDTAFLLFTVPRFTSSLDQNWIFCIVNFFSFPLKLRFCAILLLSRTYLFFLFCEYVPAWFPFCTLLAEKGNIQLMGKARQNKDNDNATKKARWFLWATL